MKKKGFTLVELLAVIVVLAIIALIATPIITNVINGIEDSANKNSISLYGKAIENAIAEYELDNPNNTKTKLDLEDIQSYISYSGDEIVCENYELSTNKNIYISGCSIDGKRTKYGYGKAPVSVGEVVNYNPELDNEELDDQTLYSTNSWRVLRPENGKILIVSDIIATLEIDGYNGYLNGVQNLNELCEKYGNGVGATGARSIKTEDITTITGCNPEHHLNNKPYVFPTDSTGNYGKTVVYKNIGGTLKYSDNPNALDADFKLLQDADTNDSIATQFILPNGQALAVGESVTVTNDYFQCYLNPQLLTVEQYGAETDLIYGENVFAQSVRTYWVADQSEMGLSKAASYGIRTVGATNKNLDRARLFQSYAGENAYTYGVRAVVYLDENVSLVKDENNVWQIWQ